jgi:hypothetical protein
LYKAQQAKTPKRRTKTPINKKKASNLVIDIDDLTDFDEDEIMGNTRSLTPNILPKPMINNRSSKSIFHKSKNYNKSVIDSSGVYQFLERQYKVHCEKERVSRLKQTGYTYRK